MVTISRLERAIARTGSALAVVLALAGTAPAFYAGGGKDADKGNDCLIGYNGIEASDVTQDGKKQVVSCMDCDPSCDTDGAATANGSCTFQVGVCIDQPNVEGCTPAAGLDAAKATAEVKGVKGKLDVQVPQLLEGSACGAFLGLVVPVKDTKNGPQDGSGTLTLSAQVKKNKSAGIAKARKDKDKLTYVCVPRPAGEPCPFASTTTTSSVPTTVTSTTSSSSTSTSSSTSSSSTTTEPTTSTTQIVTTTTSSSTSSSTSTSIPNTTSTTEITSTSSTSTSTSSSTSTSEPAPTTTSEPPPTSTSTTETTTSTTIATTTSTSSSTTTSTTTSTIIPALCGNGALNPGETCDDGNNSDNDGCPADCFIAACTPLAGTSRQVTVSFDAPAGVSVAGLTLLMNYPEAKVFLPPAGPTASLGSPTLVRLYPTSQVTLLAADLGTAGIDSGYAVRALMGSVNPVPHGAIFRLIFQDCTGAAAPLPGEFNCNVLTATDPGSNPLNDVTCSVTIP